jgi:hypothetical protein
MLLPYEQRRDTPRSASNSCRHPSAAWRVSAWPEVPHDKTYRHVNAPDGMRKSTMGSSCVHMLWVRHRFCPTLVEQIRCHAHDVTASRVRPGGSRPWTEVLRILLGTPRCRGAKFCAPTFGPGWSPALPGKGACVRGLDEVYEGEN